MIVTILVVISAAVLVGTAAVFGWRSVGVRPESPKEIQDYEAVLDVLRIFHKIYYRWLLLEQLAQSDTIRIIATKVTKDLDNFMYYIEGIHKELRLPYDLGMEEREKILEEVKTGLLEIVQEFQNIQVEIPTFTSKEELN